MFFSKLTKIEKVALKPDNTRIAFFNLFIKLIIKILKNDKVFKGVLSVIKPELVDCMSKLFKGREEDLIKSLEQPKNKEKPRRADYLEKAALLRLSEFKINEKTQLNNYWNEFVDSVLTNDVNLLQNKLSLFCIRCFSNQTLESTFKMSLKALLQNKNCFEKLLRS